MQDWVAPAAPLPLLGIIVNGLGGKVTEMLSWIWSDLIYWVTLVICDKLSLTLF